MTHQDLVRAKAVPVGYLAPSAADMPIVAIFLSGHVSCVLLRQTFGGTTTWANRCAAERRVTVSNVVCFETAVHRLLEKATRGTVNAQRPVGRSRQRAARPRALDSPSSSRVASGIRRNERPS